jgi:hypothetical protein
VHRFTKGGKKTEVFAGTNGAIRPKKGRTGFAVEKIEDPLCEKSPSRKLFSVEEGEAS